MKLMPSAEQLDRLARMHSSTSGESYVESLRFVERFFATEGEPLQFAGADPVSVDLHNEIRQVLEEAKARGQVLKYVEAARIVEKRRRAKS